MVVSVSHNDGYVRTLSAKGAVMAFTTDKSSAQACLDVLTRSRQKSSWKKDEEQSNGWFGEMMSSLMESATVKYQTPAKVAADSGSATADTRTSASEMADFSKTILAYLDDEEFAAKGFDELAKGLGDDFAKHAEDATKLYRASGVAFASIQMGGTLFCIGEPLKLPVIPPEMWGNFDHTRKVTGEFEAERKRRQQPEYLEMIKQREETYRRLVREQNESGVTARLRDDFEMLSARAALVKAADTIEGFSAEYAADPRAAVQKHAQALSGLMSSVSITMNKDGVACNF